MNDEHEKQEKEVPVNKELTVIIRSFPESNGKKNWTAMMVRKNEPNWGGLVGTAGGVTITHGEYWNRVAYNAERARYLLGERDTEPCISDYGKDITDPTEFVGESAASIERSKRREEMMKLAREDSVKTTLLESSETFVK